MVRNGIKTGVMMHGGWHYLQPIEGSSQTLRIEAQSYEILENRVFEFRIQNTEVVETGSATRERVQEDLARAICTAFPDQCVGGWSAPIPTEAQVKQRYESPINRITDWFKTLMANSLEFVDAATAANRSAICVKCPLNIGWRTGCAPCVESVETRILRIRGSRQTPNDMGLQFCRSFGHHNKLNVWLKTSFSEAKYAPPDACWLK
jgi:hypothetical protein